MSIGNYVLFSFEKVVLIEKQSPESELVWVGRTAQQAPDIDGITYVGSADCVQVGAIVKARVTQSTDYDLVAEPIGLA